MHATGPLDTVATRHEGAADAAGIAPTPMNAPESPKDILKRRYAAGEIEREEYLQKLGDL